MEQGDIPEALRINRFNYLRICNTGEDGVRFGVSLYRSG